MAVEKMKIVGLIGDKSLVSKALRLIVLNGNMHFINALTYVNSHEFALPPSEENIEALEEFPYLKTYSSKQDFSSDEQIIKTLFALFDMSAKLDMAHIRQDYEYSSFIDDIRAIYEKVKVVAETIQEKKDLIHQKREYITNLEYLKLRDLDIGQLSSMKYLRFRLLKLSRNNYLKLKKNYENIPAVVLKICEEGKKVIVASVTPVGLEETVEKIFSSLNYTVLPLPDDYNGKAEVIIEKLNQSIEEDYNCINKLKQSIREYREFYGATVEKAYSRLMLEKKVEGVKAYLAEGEKLFFMFGFVPQSALLDLKNLLETSFKHEEIIILTDDVEKNSQSFMPPTKLINPRIFAPFEALVKMYGMPSYYEKDPTVFFGLTYMLLFGMMFGDVGQGLVLLSAGIILKKMFKRTSLGGVLSSIGFSSVLFGLFYGSIFGSEEIIPAILVRPMENINQMLIAAIILGIGLTLVGYLYNILNSRIEGNIEEGIFGRNGISGLIFYVLLIYAVSQAFLAKSGISPVLIYAMAGALALMVFKQPLAKKLQKADSLYEGSPTDYYIEEGFGIIETLLSMLSNTISFIRVGAFALNHVGLYIAFATMGKMMGSAVGNVSMLVLGNVVIIGLEGLIVFIQALRLEYYELFAKYYRDDGIEYAPARLKINRVSSL
jgi:V/A-type H+-transporting ATPase subunit I